MALLTIKNRLIIGYASMVALISLGTGSAIWLSESVSDNVDILVNNSIVARVSAEEARSNFLLASASEKDFFRLYDEAFVDKANAKIELANVKLGLLRQAIFDDADKDKVKDASEMANQYQKLLNELVGLYKYRGLTEKEGLQGSFRKAVHTIEDSVKKQGLADLTVTMLMSRRHEKDYMLRGDKKYLDRITKRIEEFKQQMRVLNLSVDEQASINAQWRDYYNGISDLAETDDKIKAKISELDEVTLELSLILDEIGQRVEVDIDDETESVYHNIELTEQILIIILIVAVVIGVVIAGWIIISITRPLGITIDQANKISAGDLTHKTRTASSDEIGRLLKTQESMRQKLIEVIKGIKSGANEVSSTSEQVSQGNANLSQRTQEQASSLEEVASSMEEMIGTVNQNAENAQQANQLATAARGHADKGGEVVTGAVTAMAEISDSSSRIVDIIGVIDEIAFQTNLLALNAAVEAARAGEQGRGFAVVASEVRNLAGRSAKAAKEIKGLINDSVAKVVDGSTLVDQTGDALKEIVDSVKKVSDIIAEIAAASQEQSDGIGQVNKALLQMDEMTQQNASLVEEAAAASEAMGAQAQELSSLVAYFKLDDKHTTATPRQVQHLRPADTEKSPPELEVKPVRVAPKPGLPTKRQFDNSDDGEWQEF